MVAMGASSSLVVGPCASRSIASGVLAPDRRSPHLPGPWPSGSFEVRSPVTVAGPRRIRTGFPSATGDTVTPRHRSGYLRAAMTALALGPRLVVGGTHSGVGKTTVA